MKKWLIERTDCNPRLFLASFYGQTQWTEYEGATLQYDTEEEARKAWDEARELRPELDEHNAHVEIRVHHLY